MSYFRAVGSLMQKQKIFVNYWWQAQNSEYLLSNSSLPCRNNCNFVDALTGKNTLNASRNFSTTCTLCSSKEGVNQRKEKMKNYIVFGAIMITFVVVFSTSIALQKVENYDRVFIEIPKEQKK